MWTRRSLCATLAGLAATRLVSASAKEVRWRLVPFATSPFPYDGSIPNTATPFLDTERDGQRAHTSPRGGVYGEMPTYGDRRVLLAPAPRIEAGQSALVVFLHGNLAALERDVVQRQRIVAQFAASGIGGALIAPQFAVDALDSSAGHFWDEGGFARFLDEATDQLARVSGRRREIFARMPVILVAYSGGYLPAASILARGGADKRIAGVVLMDALYGEEQSFADWLVVARRQAFFFSAYSPSSASGNAVLRAALAARGVPAVEGMPAHLAPGTTAFLETGPVAHNDFMTHAWTRDPLRLVLSRVRL